MQQKLVTVYLDNAVYKKPKEMHGQVEEHLQEYLAGGWIIKSLVGIGSGTELYARGWIGVLLEKT